MFLLRPPGPKVQSQIHYGSRVLGHSTRKDFGSFGSNLSSAGNLPLVSDSPSFLRLAYFLVRISLPHAQPLQPVTLQNTGPNGQTELEAAACQPSLSPLPM